MKPKTLGIIGLGLMGGSLAATVRKKFQRTRVLAISRNKSALRAAKQKKWIHEGITDLRDGIAACDFVVICTPVDTFPQYLKELDRYCTSGTIVTDVGSVKEEIRKKVRRTKWKNIRFVSAHPMVGSHRRGFEAASPHLYDQGYTFVIREKGMDLKSYHAVKGFWKKISPSVVEVSPSAHDRIVGDISHLPHVIAICLMLAVHPESLNYVAAGFRDGTRIAEGHPSVWVPIFQANRKEILSAIERFQKQMGIFRKASKFGQIRELRKMMALALKRRLEI